MLCYTNCSISVAFNWFCFMFNLSPTILLNVGNIVIIYEVVFTIHHFFSIQV